MKPRAISALDHAVYADVGHQQGLAVASRGVEVLGIGTPYPGVAGNGAAGAPIDVTALGGRDVHIETSGDCLVRVHEAIGDVVTAAIWHFSIAGGRGGRTFPLSPQYKYISAWGLGGAWNFVAYAIDGGA